MFCLLFEKFFNGNVALSNSQDRESQCNEGTLDDLQEYARKLLESTTRGIGQARREDDEDAPIGCREAVEILTRNPKKSMSRLFFCVSMYLYACGSLVRREQGRREGCCFDIRKVGLSTG